MTKMNHKLLLGAAIAFASLQQAHAVPFAPADARAMGMGGTGVSSAEVASTVQYNPALLATTRDDDHFGLKIPQFAVSVADDDGFIDSVENFDDTDENGNTNIDLLQNALDVASTSLPNLEAAVQALNSADNAAALDTARDNLNAALLPLQGTVTSNPGATEPDSDLVIYSDLIADDLDALNNKALRINVGGNVALAVPSKKFSLALSAGAQAAFSGRVLVSNEDSDLMRNYAIASNLYLDSVVDVQQSLDTLIDAQTALEADPGNTALQNAAAAAADDLDAAQTAVDDFSYGGTAGQGNTVIFTNGALVETDTNLTSQIQMIGVSIADIGLTASRVFNIKGHDISFGITPKLQKITIFDYIQDLDSEDEFDSDTITENTEDYSSFNIDLGAAYQFGSEGQFQTGLVIKNLMGKDYESTTGYEISVSPMVRAGISHRTSWTKVAFDLDLTENDPIAFEDPTQYAALGAELNVFRIVQLRAGYRANLAGSDQDVVTAGIGLSPLAIHLDLGVMANASDPEKEAGIALEFGVEF